jgi:hypothetical protein
MDAWCEICGKRWDSRDPGVRYIYGDGRYECFDEVQCFGRRSIRSALDVAARLLQAVPDER